MGYHQPNMHVFGLCEEEKLDRHVENKQTPAPVPFLKYIA